MYDDIFLMPVRSSACEKGFLLIQQGVIFFAFLSLFQKIPVEVMVHGFSTLSNETLSRQSAQICTCVHMDDEDFCQMLVHVGYDALSALANHD